MLEQTSLLSDDESESCDWHRQTERLLTGVQENTLPTPSLKSVLLKRHLLCVNSGIQLHSLWKKKNDYLEFKERFLGFFFLFLVKSVESKPIPVSQCTKS